MLKGAACTTEEYIRVNEWTSLQREKSFTEGNTLSTETNYKLRREFTFQQFRICLFFLADHE